MYGREAVKRFLRDRVARPASSGVIVENSDGSALVLKAHYKPYWSFPGGWIENGQTPREAALRELQEETGLVVAVEDIVFDSMVNRISDLMQSYQFIFRVTRPMELTAEQITLQASEISDWKLVTRQDVLEDLESYGGAVQSWAEDLSDPYSEQHL